MTNDKGKTPPAKGQSAAGQSSDPASRGNPPAQSPKTPASAPATIKPLGTVPHPAPLFRKIDWLTLLVTFAVVWIGYYLTIAPEQTLEDSGELATGSFYAGIPHPPGYPVWTIYTWLWTVLLPLKNIAWRVALGEATGGALAAGLLGLLVSRGSSLLMEGIEDLKAMVGRWENAICMVSGFVSGMLIGFNGFMWSQSVIVEVYAFSVASLMVVLLCLLRWIYAPLQRRYLYFALFFHGISFTNHQTLIVAAMGIEVAIAAANFRMGRNLWLFNSIVYLCGLILKANGMLGTLEQNHAVLVIYHIVGICSMALYSWFTIVTRETFPELCLDAFLAATFLLLVAGIAVNHLIFLLVLGAIAGVVKFGWDTRRLGLEWLVVIACGFCWIAGAAFYFYMPLAGMTNPPMEWGYPRTVEGFFHAFTRGQYEKANPSDIIHHPFIFITQLGMLGTGIVEEFNWVYAFLGLIPLLFFLKMHRRERAWLTGITAIWFFLAILLLILLNPPADRQAQGLVRVFFTASHTLISLMVGYGLTLIAAYMATHFAAFRRWGIWGGAAAASLALYSLLEAVDPFLLPGENITGLKHLVAALAASVVVGGVATVVASGALEKQYLEDAKTTTRIGIVACLATFIVIEAFLWFTDAQVGNFSGIGALFRTIIQAFAKHQYGLPIFAGLILIGMAVIFIVSIFLYKKRAPLGITLILFALMPLHSIMTHWSDNEQRNHWFGYWFGHDMFTPPFKGADGKPLYPEMTKDAVLFGGTDPGRFCPTYMIFCDSFVPHDQQPAEDQKFDRRDVYIITQNALADGTYLNYIRAQYNRSAEHDPPFFTDLGRMLLKDADYQTNFLARSMQPLDDIFEGLGDRIEKRRRTFTSWFSEKEFTDFAGFCSKLRSQQDPLSKFIYSNLSPETQQLITGQSNDKRLVIAVCKDLNVLIDRELQIKDKLADKKAELDGLEQEGSASERKTKRRGELEKEIAELSKIPPLYEPERFKHVQFSEYLQDFIKENPQLHTRVRLNRLLLEEAYPKEIAKSLGGVYPDREIYCPSPDDSQRCFQDYLQDAQRRLQLNQLKPGEDVHVVENRVQVSGQVAVMAINGLLTKVIFEHNPKNEFFVEESFPLDWMYSYLTPFGIIMKINRQPLPELTEEIVKRDHEFWKQYSKRLTGDVVDYDTPLTNIAAFIEKTYLRRDFSGFTGDRKFVRDDQAQKAFSKLRSSIGGIYAWRISDPNNRNPVVQQRMIREAEFAFKQAFAFCPYSPEAVFRYVNLLLGMRRFEDAYVIASTCLKLDPYNGQVIGLVKNLEDIRRQQAGGPAGPGTVAPQPQLSFEQMEQNVREHPEDFQAAFTLAGNYLATGQTNHALPILERVLNNPNVNGPALRALVEIYSSINSTAGLQSVAAKLSTQIQTNRGNPEIAVSLSLAYRALQKNNEALQVLDGLLNGSNQSPTAILLAAQEYAAMRSYDKLETALEKLVKSVPDSAEAWYDLAALKAQFNKNQESLEALRHAFELSAKRRRTDPKAQDMIAAAKTDPRFAAVRNLPEFSKLPQK
jgi:thioredoxin-like negative regulator of GroEL